MKLAQFILMAAAGLLAASHVVAQPVKRGGSFASSPVLQSWMSPEVRDAWRQGYQGKGATITVVDDFKSQDLSFGRLNGSIRLRRHGEWTLDQARLLAPQATMRSHDFTSGSAVSLAPGFNVLNLSYAMLAPKLDAGVVIGWTSQESSIIGYARNGQAVIAKAAGNDYGTAVDQFNPDGLADYLNTALIGAKSAVFVGALNTNGTPKAPATMTDYSNVAGSNVTVQNQFLVVGVEGHKTNLYGTSFAAPIVSGYAAILSSKFTRATHTEIVNQLLNSARRDTIRDYNPAVHGRGEASISRALAPVSIQ